MRTFRSSLASRWMLNSCCMLCVFLCAAGEAESEKDKPKEKPFKFDAWCAFSDLMPDRLYISPNAPIDPENDHVRPGVEKLGGFGRRGQWSHVIVDLKNTTDPADKIRYEGFSHISFDDTKPDNPSESTYGCTYRQAFQVAPQTEKPYQFSVYCPEGGWNETRVVDILTSNRPYSRSFRIHDLDAHNELLIVVVSEQPGAFKYLGPRIRSRDDPDAALGPQETGRQVATVAPSELPTRWHDLALASLVIIDGPPAGGLRPEQWDALKSYAQSGGKILIMAGKDPNRLKGAVEDLAGIVVRNSVELPMLDQFENRFPLVDEKNKELRVPIIEVTAPGAGYVKRNTGTQIVEYSEKSYGAGRVAFIPFSLSDHMFENWPQRYDIPLKLLHAERNLFSINVDEEAPYTESVGPYGNNYTAKNKQTALAALRNTLDTSFASDTPVITQSPQTVLWFVIIYLICAVPLNYIIFALLRRREAAWLTVPVWAISFAIGAYYLGYSGQTGVVTVNEVSIIEAGSGQHSGIGRTFMGVYAPRRGDYQIEFPPLSSGYDTQAAPTHLVNTESMGKREFASFPTMQLREEGDQIKIEDILIQTRDTRRFEIQHRAALNDGLLLKFANAHGDMEDQSAAFGASAGATLQVANSTGRVLFNPIFIKNGKYVELQPRNQQPAGFLSGQTLESNSASNEWRPLDDQILEKLTAHFSRSGDSKHVEIRAHAVSNYFRQHAKQYAAGVFVAWSDGASLPIRIGPTGSQTEEPNLEGITLLVVPAAASNRGGRDISLKKNPPRLLYTTAYSPEDRSSGDWKPCGKEPIPIKIFDDPLRKCAYLRLQFDADFGQYVYEGKAAQLTFSVASRVKGSARFNGEISVFARNDAAKDKRERFTAFGIPLAVSLSPGTTTKVAPLKFEFTRTELFTGSSIILKIQAQSDDGAAPPLGLTLENAELRLVDK